MPCTACVLKVGYGGTSCGTNDDAVDAFLEDIIHGDDEEQAAEVQKTDVESQPSYTVPQTVDTSPQNAEQQRVDAVHLLVSSQQTAPLDSTVIGEGNGKYLDETQQMEEAHLREQQIVDPEPMVTGEEVKEEYMDEARQEETAQLHQIVASRDDADAPELDAENIENFLEDVHHREITSFGAHKDDGLMAAEDVEKVQLREHPADMQAFGQYPSLPGELPHSQPDGKLASLDTSQVSTQSDGPSFTQPVIEGPSDPLVADGRAKSVENADKDIEEFLQGVTSTPTAHAVELTEPSDPEAEIDNFLQDIKEERSPTTSQRNLAVEEQKDMSGTDMSQQLQHASQGLSNVADGEHTTDHAHEDIAAFLQDVKPGDATQQLEHSAPSDLAVQDTKTETIKDVKKEKAKPNRPRKHRSLIPPPMWSWDKNHEEPGQDGEDMDRHHASTDQHTEHTENGSKTALSAAKHEELPDISNEVMHTFLENVISERGTPNTDIVAGNPSTLIRSISHPGVVGEKVIPSPR